MISSILILLGSIGVLLVWRHASDAAYVSWGIVLLCVNLWITESAKHRRRTSAVDASVSYDRANGDA